MHSVDDEVATGHAIGEIPLAWRAGVKAVPLAPQHLAVLTEASQHLFSGTAYLGVGAVLAAKGAVRPTDLLTALEDTGVGSLAARLAVAHLENLGLLAAPRTAPTRTLAVLDLDRGLETDPANVPSQARYLSEALALAGVEPAASATTADLVVVLTPDYLDERLAAVDREHRDRGVPWLLASLVSGQAWYGPLFTPGRGPCWSCMAQRLRLNRQVRSAVLQRAGLPDGPPPTVWSETSLRLAAHTLAVEVQHQLTYGSDDLSDRLVTVDLATNALDRHTVVRRPQCRECGDPSRVRADLRRIAAGEDSSAGVFDRLAHHISPVTGIVTALTEVRQDGYLFASTSHAFPMHTYDFRVLRDNLLGRSGGKGLDPLQARTSALCEALERYSGIWQGEEERVLRDATAAQVGARAVRLDSVLGFSAAQYANRDAWNESTDDPHGWVPRQTDPETPLDWVPFTSLTTGEERYLPATFSFYGHPDAGHRFCAPDSNGCAAGGTASDAISRGLLELIERDAVALWWYNRAPCPSIDLGICADTEVSDLVDLIERHDRRVWLLDLTNDLGVPVVAALSATLDGPSEEIIYGFGADCSRAAAVRSAVLELGQSLWSVLRAPGASSYRTDQPYTRRWLQSASLAEMPYLAPGPQASAAMSGADGALDARPEDRCAALTARLAAQGLDVLALDQTRPDVGLPVWRVVVPGLCHFWRRLGPARLYDVPVRLGWRAEPIDEGDLNPWSIYF